MKIFRYSFFLGGGGGGGGVGAMHGAGFQALDCSSLKMLVFCFW